MTDRELLELAAKAAGISAHWGDGWQSDMMFVAVPRPNSPLVTNIEWNPIIDDGDALRLAVKLGLSVQVINKYKETQVFRQTGYTLEKHSADPYAATRRAIVGAAAEIGRQA